MNINIADIHFLIRCKDMPILREPYRKTYAPFIKDTPCFDEGSVCVDVSLEIDNFPDVGQYPRIFEDHDSWSMFRNGDEYFWIDLPLSAGSAPLCLARFHRRPEKATVYCSESLITEAEGMKMLMNPVSYPLDQLLLMYSLAERGGALIHASAVEFNGKGYIFPGRSGAGKSTISRIFESKGYDLLSDDRVVIRKINGGFYAYGTPWAGDAGIANNRKLPLGGICFIRQNTLNRIEGIAPVRAAELFMPVTSIPWFDENGMSAILMFLEDVVLNVPAYELHFAPDVEVVNIFEKFVSGQ